MKKLLAALALLLLPALAAAQSSPAKFPGLQMAANNSMPVCVAGSLCVRYNSGTAAWEVSIAGAAYVALPTTTSTSTLTNKTLTSPTISNPLITGTATITLAKPTHITNNSSAPAISTPPANVQFGVAPTAAMVGGDVGGNLTLTTGTGPTAFAAATAVSVGTITWNVAFTAAPKAVPLYACNTNAADFVGSVTAYVDIATCTTTTCVVKMIGSTTVLTPTLTASTAYQYCYTVVQ